MKILIVIVLIILTGCTNLPQKESKELQFVRFLSTAAVVADWGQTRWISKNYANGHAEANPYLGKYPSTRRVDIYFTTLLLTQALLNKTGTDQTKWLTNLYFLIEHGAAVHHNYSVGVGFSW